MSTFLPGPSRSQSGTALLGNKPCTVNIPVCNHVKCSSQSPWTFLSICSRLPHLLSPRPCSRGLHTISTQSEHTAPCSNHLLCPHWMVSDAKDSHWLSLQLVPWSPMCTRRSRIPWRTSMACVSTAQATLWCSMILPGGTLNSPLRLYHRDAPARSLQLSTTR